MPAHDQPETFFFFFLPRHTNSFNVLDDTTAIAMYKSKKDFQTLILNVLKRIKFAKIQNSTTYVQKRAPFTKKSFNQIQPYAVSKYPHLRSLHLTTWQLIWCISCVWHKCSSEDEDHGYIHCLMRQWLCRQRFARRHLMKLISDRLLR